MKTHNKHYYYGMMVMLGMIWGSAYPLVRHLTTSGIDPYLVAVLRLQITTVFAAIMLLFSKDKFDVRVFRKNFWPYFFQSMIGVFGFFCVMNVGIAHTTASKSALIVGSNPIVIVILSYFILKEQLSKYKLVGIILAIGGVFLTAVGEELATGQSLVFYPYDLVLLLGCLFWSVYSIMGRYYGDRLAGPQKIFFIFACSFVLVIPLDFVYAKQIASVTLEQWLLLIYCGVVPGGLGYFIWNKGLSVLGASVCGMFNSLMPVCACLLSAIALNERMAWVQIVGGILVVGGVLLGLMKVTMPVNYETGHSLTEGEANA